MLQKIEYEVQLQGQVRSEVQLRNKKEECGHCLSTID
jgi:hypothetical protein